MNTECIYQEALYKKGVFGKAVMSIKGGVGLVSKTHLGKNLRAHWEIKSDTF